ncbi:hypothetical protein [Kutzneria buriramensis]|nr:hypothetical protein [Kutzneria buriramensis]
MSTARAQVRISPATISARTAGIGLSNTSTCAAAMSGTRDAIVSR